MVQDINSELNVLDRMLRQVHRVVQGNKDVAEEVAYCIAAGGHVLLESVPGLAKTLMFKAFARTMSDGEFKRVQMTPNLLPSDIMGSEILNMRTNKFRLRRGPIFCNVFLADEINRAIPKTQSALLEAMAESQVTIAGRTLALPELFLVGATMNPVEQEGTYELPEAQLDRFMVKVRMRYVQAADEKAMLRDVNLRSRDPLAAIEQVVSMAELVAVRERIRKEMHVSDAALDYIVNLVRASRKPDAGDRDADNMFRLVVNKGGSKKDQPGGIFESSIALGASPRAQQSLMAMASVRAFHKGRMYVIPEDIRYVFPDVMRHRLLLERRARANKYTPDDAIKLILAHVPVLDGDSLYKPC